MGDELTNPRINNQGNNARGDGHSVDTWNLREEGQKYEEKGCK